MENAPGRRRLAAAAIALATALAGPALAETDAWVVLLVSQPTGPQVVAAESLSRALRDAAGVELELRDLEHSPERAAQILSGLAADPPDLVITVGEGAARLADGRLPPVPRVRCLAEPPADEAVATLSHGPGSQLDFLARVVPEARTIGVLYSTEHSRAAAEQLQADAAEIY